MSIVVKLMGGLGNQMFQYAFGKAIEKNTGIDVMFDNSDFISDVPHRDYELCHFNTNLRFTNMKKHKSLFKKILREFLIFKSLKNKIDVYKFKPVYKKLNVSNPFKFDSEYKNIKDGEYIMGFYQNERYFIDIADKLREDFRIATPLDNKNQMILEDIKNNESISVHIRRGDYLVLKDSFGVLSKEYYQQALSFIKDKNDSKKLKAFIFTDDPEWVKDNINLDISSYFVDNNQGKGYFDLELMKHCKHNIIANSSFSWWGAWLNENPNKIVVAPKPWFLSENDDYELIPKSWTRIQGFN